MAGAGLASQGEEISRENRFVYLLQPIRDLASNWDIDIAAELEEYLDELEKISFTFENERGPGLNFAEAALLIQGTTCVYSRKVEHLHTLVYQALEAVFNKKKAQAEGQAGRKQRAAAVEEEDDGDFLAAGLELKIAEDIDLAGEDSEETHVAFSRVPAALLALEDQGSGQGADDSGFYRLAQCFVHASGALLLDLKDGNAYDAHLTLTRSAAPVEPSAQPDDAAAAHEDAAFDEFYAAGEELAAGAAEEDEDDDPMPIDCFDDGQPMEPPNASGEPADMEEAPDAAGPQQSQPMAPFEVSAQAWQEEQQQQQLGGQDDEPQPQAAEKPFYDPYKPLVASEKGSLPIKPLQVKKPSSRSTAARLAVVARQQQAAAAVGGAAGAAAGLGSLNFPEFGYALGCVLARARQARSGGSGARAGPGARHVAASAFDWADAVALAQQEAAQYGGEPSSGLGVEEQAAAGAGAGGEALADGALPADMDDPAGDAWGDAWDEDGDAGGDGAIGMEDVFAAGGPMGAAAAAAAGGDASGAGGPSYEDLCRAHIESMIARAAAQETQTELTQRVSGWRSKIDPVLTAEESRASFDIQAVQQCIITKLGSLAVAQPPAQPGPEAEAQPAEAQEPKVVPFTRMAAAPVKYEVSRTFAAMLQLINNRNIRLVQQPGGPQAPFQVQLLSARLAHEEGPEDKGQGQGRAAKGQAAAAEGAGAALQPGADAANRGGRGGNAGGAKGKKGGSAKAKSGKPARKKKKTGDSDEDEDTEEEEEGGEQGALAAEVAVPGNEENSPQAAKMRKVAGVAAGQASKRSRRG